MDNNTIRLLAASGPLMPQNFGQGMQRPMLPQQMAAAAAAGMDQAAQFSQALRAQMMCQNMNPELSPEMIASLNRGPFMMDPSQMGFHPYLGFDGGRRKNATREITQPLKTWLTEHKRNPYPTKPEKVLLAMLTGMTLTQVSTWFANARRRLKKENRMTWSPRNGRNDSDDDDDDEPAGVLDTSSDQLKHIKQDTHNNSHSSHSSQSQADIKPNLSAISSDLDSPKKSKIWSIVDSVDHRSESAASNTSNNSTKHDDDSKTMTPTSQNGLGGLGLGGGQMGMNPMMAAMMSKLMPPQVYAMMQQQAFAQQQHQQQQMAAAMRSNPYFLNGLNGLNGLLGMHGMNLPGPSAAAHLPGGQLPSTSSTSASPTNLDSTSLGDSSSEPNTSTSNQANVSGSGTATTTTSEDRESRSPSSSPKMATFTTISSMAASMAVSKASLSASTSPHDLSLSTKSAGSRPESSNQTPIVQN